MTIPEANPERSGIIIVTPFREIADKAPVAESNPQVNLIQLTNS